jgi:hypothetical protein
MQGLYACVCHRVGDVGSKHLWNVSKRLQDYIVQHIKTVIFKYVDLLLLLA